MSTYRTGTQYIVTQTFNGDVQREFEHRTLAAATRRVKSLSGAGEGWGVRVRSTDPSAPREIAGFDVFRA